MPIRRAGLGGAVLGGVGDTLIDFANQRVKRRELQDARQENQLFEIQKMRMQQQAQHDAQVAQMRQQMLNNITEKVGTNITGANEYLNRVRGNPLLTEDDRQYVDSLQPAEPELVSALQQGFAKTDKAINLPDETQLQNQARHAGITVETPPQEPVAGAQFLDPNMKPDAFYQPTPALEELRGGVATRHDQIRQAKKEEIADAGELEYAKKYNQDAAGFQATDEHTWQAGENAKLLEEMTRAGKVATAQQMAQAESLGHALGEGSPAAIAAKLRIDNALAEQKQAQTLKEQRDRVTNGVIDPQRQAAIFQAQNAYQSDTKYFRGKEQAYRTMLSAAGPELAKDKDHLSAAAGVTIIFAYMKMVDPTGSVQQGEADRLINASGVPPWLKNLYSKALNGNPLPQETIRDFLNQAHGQYMSALDQQKQDNARYSNTARNAFQVPPEYIIAQLDPELEKDPTAPAAPPPASQRAAEVGKSRAASPTTAPPMFPTGPTPPYPLGQPPQPR